MKSPISRYNPTLTGQFQWTLCQKLAPPVLAATTRYIHPSTTSSARACTPKPRSGIATSRLAFSWNVAPEVTATARNARTKNATTPTSIIASKSQPLHGASSGAADLVSGSVLPRFEKSAELCSAWTGEGARPHTGAGSVGGETSGRSSGGKVTRIPLYRWARARW